MSPTGTLAPTSPSASPPSAGVGAGPPAPPAAPPSGGRLRSASSRRRAPWWLLVPGVLVAAAMLLPPVYLVIRAGGAGMRAVEILGEASTGRVLANSAGLAVAVTVLCVALAVPIAWLTQRTDLPGRRIWGVLTILPLVIPTYVGAFTYVAAFGPRGTLQAVLAPLGIERLPAIYGWFGATLTLTLFSYPYVLLTVRGAMSGLDPALEESARSLGLSPIRTFRRVVLPQLRPAIAAGALLAALYVLSDFGAVSIMRFSSFTRAIYLQYSAAFDRTPAAVLALLLVAFTIGLLIVEQRARGGAAYHRLSAGPARRAAPIPLGRWKLPALAFLSTVVVLALLVPLGVLAFWLVRGVSAGEPLRFVAEWAWNSVRASGLGAVVAAAGALPIAILAVRHRGPAAVALERTAYLGYALPGIVVALALVFFGARYSGPLYQTLPMLVLAYVVLFLPQAVAATRASLLQVPPNLEEAARGLGSSGPGAMWRVTVPLVRPGVFAGMALVFLTAMKELPATLLLGPSGHTTLATAVWNATSEAFFARAAAPALLLVLLAGVPLAILLSRNEHAGSLR